MWLTRFLLVAPWLLPIAMGIFVGTTVVNVPMFDEWIWVPLIVKLHYGTLTIADLWDQQNVHRSFFPTLIALGLARAFGWNIRIETLANVALVALTQLVLYRFLLASLPLRRAAVAFAVSSLLLFSLVQSENWIWGFQISWFLANLGAIVVCTSLPRRGFAIAAVAAVVASYSLIFGLGTWIAGASILAAGGRRRELVGWLALAGLTTVLYFVGFGLPPSETGFLAGLNPGDAVQFFLAYLGTPVGVPLGRWPCEGIGLALVIASAFAFLRVRQTSVQIATFVLGLLTFTLAAAVMETIGRSLGGPDAAVFSRYATAASMGWIALSIAVCALWPAAQRGSALGVAVAFAVVMFFIDVVGWVNSVVLEAVQATVREIVILDGQATDDDLWPYYSSPEQLRRYVRELRNVGDGPFLRQEHKGS